jgi:hypothetical protein
MDANQTVNAVHSLAPSRPTSAAAASSRAATRQAGADLDFGSVLAKAQRPTAGGVPPSSRWRRLGFLSSYSVPRMIWPWATSGLELLTDTLSSVSSPWLQTGNPLSISDYPRPTDDNGRGIHWIPTVSQTAEVVDRFVEEAVGMGMKWVVFLNEGTDVGANDYLVEQLSDAGIEPVMRVYTPGLVPIEGDLQAMVSHYAKLGVRYFQLYNEPNLMVETHGQSPDVDRYLDLWLPAAQEVLAGGGLPGFGALSPQGEVEDFAFLRTALDRLKARGKADVLDRAWLSLHNYTTGIESLNDPNGFLRFRQYDAICRSAIGRSLPIIGTEGGSHVSSHVSEQEQIATVTGGYRYMSEQPEPYFFANTYWIIANGHDPAWDHHALVRPDGPTALAQALRNMAAGGNV